LIAQARDSRQILGVVQVACGVCKRNLLPLSPDAANSKLVGWRSWPRRVPNDPLDGRVILGRETYDSFAGAWPKVEAAGEGADAEFAKHLGDARKIVVSNQQLTFTWRNSEQLKGDLVEAVTALKNEPGNTHIAMSGSPSVVRQLLAAGLLDELHVLVHPIAVGKGMRLFDSESPIPLKLISSGALTTGVLDLVYAPA
jgi:dihydrofolate reductase